MNDTQRQRWIKYGGNVLLSSVIVVAIAVLVTWAAERRPKRIDTTAEGLYSLKPQTIKIIRDLTTPIKLVSLYTQTKPPPSADQDQPGHAAVIPQDQAAQTVNDLLEEYANKGHNITLETIDPVTSPSKVDDLIEQVEAKYGGEVTKYAQFVQSFKGTIEQISKIAEPEVKAVDDLLPHVENPDPDLVATLREVILTVDQFPKSLGDLQDQLQRPLRQKPPDYKGATDAITEGMTGLSAVLDAVINNFTVLEKKGGLPPAVDQYMKESLPHFQAMKKIVDDSLAQAKQLGELKLDTLRSALKERNTILVMQEEDLSSEQLAFVSKFDADLAQKDQAADGELKNFPTTRPAAGDVDEWHKAIIDFRTPLELKIKDPHPDYQVLCNDIHDGCTRLLEPLNRVIADAPSAQKSQVEALRKFLLDSAAQGDKLGHPRNGWRAISYDQVWQPAGRTAMATLSDTPPKPRFAGEQQVTAAILALASGGQKPKIAIVRAGGMPLAQSMSFMGGEPPMAEAAARLGLYNFDVVEKDLTGQFAQQSGGSEPSDEEIRNATWIVWCVPGQQQNQFSEAPPSIAPQVAAHLRAGGSAVILSGYHQDAMTEALADWGIEVNPTQIIVHEKVSSNGGDSSDMLQQALRMPFIFALHDFGDHPLAKPLSSLEGVFIGICPVKIHDTKDYRATPLLPIPTTPEAPHSWATATFTPSDQNATATFDAAVDTDGPLYAGAAVERMGGGRIVVLGAGEFATNQLLDLTEQEFNADAPPVLRFPANGELFTNSVFWASHQDTLIDISPAAMDVGRIGSMTPAMLGFWRVYVLLIGLPGLVLLCAAGVYSRRRD